MSVGTALWRGSQTLDWDGKTDADGRFTWDSAPPEGIQVGFLKPGYMIAEAFFSAGGPEKTVVLQRERRFAGSVLDAETSEPIARFRVTPGESFEAGRPQPEVIWQEHMAVVGRDGAFVLRPERPVQIARIEAEGYLPITAPLSAASDPSATNRFRLKRGAGLTGKVEFADGSPAAGAEVAVKSSGTFLELGRGRFNRLGGPQESAIVKADAAGQFSLPPKAEVRSFFAVHEKGYGEVLLGGELTASAFELKQPWILQSWGRIEGVLRVNQRLAPNERVALTSDPTSADALQLGFDDYQTTTDSEGRFVLARRLQANAQSPGSSPKGAAAGLTRPEHQSLLSRRHRLHGDRRTRPAGHRPRRGEQRRQGRLAKRTQFPPHAASAAASHTQDREEFEAWAASPAVKASRDNARTYPVVFADDGSFRVDDVTPGPYMLELAIGDGGGPSPFGGRTVAELQREVVVPPLIEGRAEGALDVGSVELLPPVRSRK